MHVSLGMFIQENTRQATDVCHENWCCVNQVQGKGWWFSCLCDQKCLLNLNKTCC